jgi:hypothetical protein
MTNHQHIIGSQLALLPALTAALVLWGCQSYTKPGDQTSMSPPPMGNPQDVADADTLWRSLQSAHLVGPEARRVQPYTGVHPHGAILEILHQPLTVNGRTGLAIVKRNYGGEGVSIDKVASNRAGYLKAVTVMYQRESGYDSDNQDWFWAKYTPDGGLHVKDAQGMKIKLAGRVAKGKPEGCISCHRAAGGGDYVYASNITVK